jgi:menaquinone-dependent protoporphyrinogen oxidase
MKVMVIYASVEGQTGKIARFVAAEVKKLGHDAVLADADEPTGIAYAGVDAVILAAPVHERRHPRRFEAVIEADKRHLKMRKTLMLSVSLNAAFPEGLEEAQDYLTELKMRTEFEPDQELLVAGAVRSDRYDYFSMQIVRHVVLRDRPFDPTEDGHEYTDWKAVSSAISRFLGQKQR